VGSIVTSFEVVLKEQNILSSTTRDFRFLRTDGKSVEFRPGQFYRFNFDDERGSFERSYSLCNAENSTDGNINSKHLDLVISIVENGRTSRLLFSGTPNVKATVTGPYGRLVVPDILPKRLFLIATSVGMAPYIPIIKELEGQLRDKGLEIHFLYGVRDSSEFIYGDLLESFAEQYDHFHLYTCYSREKVAGKNAYEGYVQNRLKALTPNPESDHFLLCGNPLMIDTVYEQLKEVGFLVKQVVREKYVFAKDPVKKPAKNMSVDDKKLLEQYTKKYAK
jgi:ferredoxin--NADP+ reductase